MALVLNSDILIRVVKVPVVSRWWWLLGLEVGATEFTKLIVDLGLKLKRNLLALRGLIALNNAVEVFKHVN